ncbi:MAG: hypothetical protein ABEH64_04365 [Salinirussus sp.]
MATDTGEGFSSHLRGVTVTTIATVSGLLAGVGSAVLASGPGDTVGLIVLLAAILVQFPIYYAVGIDVGDFSAKDQLYVGFMTFTMWFISWGILLTVGAF